MAVQPTITIQVNTTEWDRFYRQWQRFQQAAARGTTINIGMGGAGFGAAATAAAGRAGAAAPGRQWQQAATHAATVTTQTQRQVGLTRQLQRSWRSMREDSGRMLRNVGEMMTRLMRVSALMSGATGLATGFGFLGMDALARMASGRRIGALTAGTTYGGLAGARGAYGAYIGDPLGLMTALTTAQRDVTLWNPLQRLIPSFRGNLNRRIDPARMLPDLLRGAAQLYQQPGMTAQMWEQQGIGRLVPYEQAGMLARLPPAEREAVIGRQAEAERRAFVKPEDLAAFTKFVQTLDISRQSIEATFITQLARLAPQLSGLTDAFTNFVNALLSNEKVGRWIDDLAAILQRWTQALKDNPEAAAHFIENVERMAATVGRVVAWIAEKLGWQDVGAVGKVTPQAGATPIPGTQGLLSPQGLVRSPRGTAYDPTTGEAYHQDEYGGWIKGFAPLAGGVPEQGMDQPTGWRDPRRPTWHLFTNPQTPSTITPAGPAPIAPQLVPLPGERRDLGPMQITPGSYQPASGRSPFLMDAAYRVPAGAPPPWAFAPPGSGGGAGGGAMTPAPFRLPGRLGGPGRAGGVPTAVEGPIAAAGKDLPGGLWQARTRAAETERAGWLMGRLQKDFGLTREQAAGIASNIAAESGIIPGRQEEQPWGGRGGLGFMQWTGPRRVAFEQWAAQHGLSTTDPEANYQFMVHELKTTPGLARIMENVKGARTAEDAARAFFLAESGGDPRIAYHIADHAAKAARFARDAPTESPSLTAAASSITNAANKIGNGFGRAGVSPGEMPMSGGGAPGGRQQGLHPPTVNPSVTVQVRNEAGGNAIIAASQIAA